MKVVTVLVKEVTRKMMKKMMLEIRKGRMTLLMRRQVMNTDSEGR